METQAVGVRVTSCPRSSSALWSARLDASASRWSRALATRSAGLDLLLFRHQSVELTSMRLVEGESFFDLSLRHAIVFRCLVERHPPIPNGDDKGLDMKGRTSENRLRPARGASAIRDT